MNKADFIALATSLAREAGVEAGLHGYFRLHQDRLWQTVEHLRLLELRGGHVLEIGPFYSYTPFVFRQAGCAVSVIEGEEPAVAPLKPVYARHGIEAVFGNLFEWFGGTASATGRLPFADEQFDAVVCFETMEHFHFNPVPFVRDLHRVLRPGGRVFITVPNQAKLDKRLALLRGRSVLPPVPGYYQFAGQAFYGFHWREYTLGELVALFDPVFTVESARYLQTFETRPDATLGRRLKRSLARQVTSLVPGFSSLCTLVARKADATPGAAQKGSSGGRAMGSLTGT